MALKITFARPKATKVEIENEVTYFSNSNKTWFMNITLFMKLINHDHDLNQCSVERRNCLGLP